MCAFAYGSGVYACKHLNALVCVMQGISMFCSQIQNSLRFSWYIIFLVSEFCALAWFWSSRSWFSAGDIIWRRCDRFCHACCNCMHGAGDESLVAWSCNDVCVCWSTHQYGAKERHIPMHKLSQLRQQIIATTWVIQIDWCVLHNIRFSVSIAPLTAPWQHRSYNRWPTS